MLKTPKYLLEDIGDFHLWNVIAVPLLVTPKSSTQFDEKNYEHILEIFSQVKRIDRKSFCL